MKNFQSHDRSHETRESKPNLGKRPESLYEVTGRIEDINTVLVSRSELHPSHHNVTHTGKVLLDLLGITDQDITALTLQCKAGELPSLTLERTPVKSFVKQGPFRFRVVAEDAPTPAAPPLDLDFMQSRAQQRLKSWIDKEASELSDDSVAWCVDLIEEQLIRLRAYTDIRKFVSKLEPLPPGSSRNLEEAWMRWFEAPLIKSLMAAA